jgi:hypothetical protein
MKSDTTEEEEQRQRQRQSADVHTEPIRPAPTATPRESGAYRTASNVSGPDDLAPPEEEEPSDPYQEEGDEVYDRLSKGRKIGVVAVLSFCAFLSPVSSTSVLSATPEVAAEYGTTGSVINLSNAGYMALMGVSPIVWGPMSQVFGRRPVRFFLNLPGQDQIAPEA